MTNGRSWKLDGPVDEAAVRNWENWYSRFAAKKETWADARHIAAADSLEELASLTGTFERTMISLGSSVRYTGETADMTHGINGSAVTHSGIVIPFMFDSITDIQGYKQSDAAKYEQIMAMMKALTGLEGEDALSRFQRLANMPHDKVFIATSKMDTRERMPRRYVTIGKNFGKFIIDLDNLSAGNQGGGRAYRVLDLMQKAA